MELREHQIDTALEEAHARIRGMGAEVVRVDDIADWSPYDLLQSQIAASGRAAGGGTLDKETLRILRRCENRRHQDPLKAQEAQRHAAAKRHRKQQHRLGLTHAITQD